MMALFKLWRFLCTIQFCLVLIYYTFLGLTPHPENAVHMFNDLLMHFTGYLVAAFSISFARPKAPLWERALFLIMFSIAIEIGQHFMPPRTFSLMDILANTTGVLCGLLLITLMEKHISYFSILLHWKDKYKV